MVKKQIKQKRRKLDPKKILRLVLIIILIIIVFIIIKNIKKDAVPDKTILILEIEDTTSNLEKDIIKKDGIIYFSLDDTKKFLDKNIYQEDKDGLIITSGEKKIAALKIDNNKVKINGSSININGEAFKNEEGTIYLPISEMENIYDIDFSYNEKSNIITIDYYSKQLIKAYTKKKVAVKAEKSGFSKSIEKVKKGNWVIYISEENGWAKIRTQSGKIGYIKSNKLANFVTEREDMQEKETKIDKQLKIDISNKDISTLNKREKIINQILMQAVSKNYKGVKITYKNKKEIDRFKIEIEPILKECGISVKYKEK